MALISETYWIFRDNYPAKRFIGVAAYVRAKTFAEMTAQNYPGSVVRCSMQKLYEQEMFVIQPTRTEPVKERIDA